MRQGRGCPCPSWGPLEGAHICLLTRLVQSLLNDHSWWREAGQCSCILSRPWARKIFYYCMRRDAPGGAEVSATVGDWEAHSTAGKLGYQAQKLVRNPGGHGAGSIATVTLMAAGTTKSQKTNVHNTGDVMPCSQPPFEVSSVISPRFQVKGVKFTNRCYSTLSEPGIAVSTISPHLTFSKQHIMKPIYRRPIDTNKFLWHLINLIMKECYERTGCTLQPLPLLICPRLRTAIRTGNFGIPML